MASLGSIREFADGIDDAELRAACLSIIDQVTQRIEQRKEVSLTFNAISKLVGREAGDPIVQGSISLLVGKRNAKLLDMHFLFFDPADDDAIGTPIEDEEVSCAYKTGYLIHPETGAKIENFEASLVPFFVPSRELVAR